MLSISNDTLLILSLFSAIVSIIYFIIQTLIPSKKKDKTIWYTPEICQSVKERLNNFDFMQPNLPEYSSEYTFKVPKCSLGYIHDKNIEARQVGAASALSAKAVEVQDKERDRVQREISQYSPLNKDLAPGMEMMMKRFPDSSPSDLERFLEARKGNKDLAIEMYSSHLLWRSKTFPIKRSQVIKAMTCHCMFPFGTAKDGTPVLFFRHAMYDKNRATPEEYVLAAVVILVSNCTILSHLFYFHEIYDTHEILCLTPVPLIEYAIPVFHF